MGKTMPPRLVTLRDLARATLVFVLAFAIGNVAAHAVASWHPFDCPHRWPLSVFWRRVPGVADVAFALVALAVFEIALRRLDRMRGALEPCLFALTIVALSTAIQGVPRGFENPIDGLTSEGWALQYFHDAQRFTGASDVLARWNTEQPRLAMHASTHPPGAVLMAVLARDALALGIAWTVLATLVASIAMRALAVKFFGNVRAGSAAVLALVALPAVQIYFGATLDAVVAALLLAALALQVTRATIASAAIVGLLLSLSALLSFGAWIAMPAFAAVEIAERKRVTSSAIALAVAIGVLALSRASGFDYVESFRAASRMENPAGFRLLVDPVDYLATRIEDVAEILFFLGPALLLASQRSWSTLAGPPRVLVLTSIGALGLAFLTGAFRTGETARACIFVAPILLLPLLACLHARPDPSSRALVLRATFGYGILLQLFGDWFW
jgi:hypothetical protein